jgi:plasmid maintenance system killer protein
VNRFADAEAERLYLTGLSARLPRGILRRAYRAIHVLVDARELQDIRVVGKIDRLKGGQRLIVCIAQKWHFTFDWERGIGSKEIRLERLKT